MEKLFLFGEEFEAILDILEDDEELEDEFTATAKDVSSKYPNLRRTINSVLPEREIQIFGQTDLVTKIARGVG